MITNNFTTNQANFYDFVFFMKDMARSVVALYIVAFFFLFLSFFTGIAGKKKQ